MSSSHALVSPSLGREWSTSNVPDSVSDKHPANDTRWGKSEGHRGEEQECVNHVKAVSNVCVRNCVITHTLTLQAKSMHNRFASLSRYSFRHRDSKNVHRGDHYEHLGMHFCELRATAKQSAMRPPGSDTLMVWPRFQLSPGNDWTNQTSVTSVNNVM